MAVHAAGRWARVALPTAAALALLVTPAGAQGAAAQDEREASLASLGGAGLAAELGGLRVQTRDLAAAQDALRRVESAIAAADGRVAEAGAELARLAEAAEARRAEQAAAAHTEAAALQRAAQEQAAADALVAPIEAGRRRLGELAVAAYIAADAAPPVAGLSPDPGRVERRYAEAMRAREQARRRELLAEREAHLAEAAAAGRDAAAAQAEGGRLAAALDALGDGRAAAEQRRAGAAGERARLSVERATRQAELARLARTAQVVTVGAPAVVVDALWRAQQRMAAERPGCGVRWSLLAAISQVESGHGGGRVDASGQASPVILGPVLDGTVFSLILDTDGGALDADTVHDRAVGPMQFIPTSWAIYARDGNGDGRRDPSNYYDAALAAAEHLCRAGHDHRDPGGVSRAVFGYNRSPTYNAKVLALADEYGALRLR